MSGGITAKIPHKKMLRELLAMRGLGRKHALVWQDGGDWRTLGLIVVCHIICLTLLFAPIDLPLWIGVFVLVPTLTLYASLQHEVIHGHPFENQTLNDLLVLVPYALIVPYYRFKDMHLAHHLDANLCDPYDDPETWYQSEQDWNQRGAFSRSIFNFNNMLVGRMLLGPLISMIGLLKSDLRQISRGHWPVVGKWALHLACVIVLLVLVSRYGSLPLLSYFISAYLGMSLVMVRTFLEHQAHEKVRGRSVIIEKGGVFGFLFLNNSFHAVHHAYPNHAWYRIPRLFRENRERFLEMNEGYAYSSYREIFKQFSFKRKEPVPLPEAQIRETRP